jgi:hypothetical protein
MEMNAKECKAVNHNPHLASVKIDANAAVVKSVHFAARQCRRVGGGGIGESRAELGRRQWQQR